MKKQILREYTQVPESEWVSVLEYYKTHTSSDTAAQFGIRDTQSFRTQLNRDYPKGFSHGGARKGAGNMHGDTAMVQNTMKKNNPLPKGAIKKIAEKLGIHRNTVRNYLNGRYSSRGEDIDREIEIIRQEASTSNQIKIDQAKQRMEKARATIRANAEYLSMYGVSET